jgi:antitoxin PrlF
VKVRPLPSARRVRHMRRLASEPWKPPWPNAARSPCPRPCATRWGWSKGSKLKVEVENGSRIILRKNVDDAVSRLRGRFKLPRAVSTDDVMRELRGRAPGDPVDL